MTTTTMASIKSEVTASLEGMKIVVDDAQCSLQEFNFDSNCWRIIDTATLPMSRTDVERWLNGWNAVDRWAALRLLIYTE